MDFGFRGCGAGLSQPACVVDIDVARARPDLCIEKEYYIIIYYIIKILYCIEKEYYIIIYYSAW